MHARASCSSKLSLTNSALNVAGFYVQCEGLGATGGGGALGGRGPRECWDCGFLLINNDFY